MAPPQSAHVIARHRSLAIRRNSRGRLVVVGVIASVAMFCAAGLVRVLSVRPFLPVDESANVDYAMRITHGQLPVAGIRIHPEFPGQRRAYQHTSNHPPLYHAIVGPILRLGQHTHHPKMGLVGARMVSLGAGALTVLLLAALAWALVGPAGPIRDMSSMIGRRGAQLMVASAALIAFLPTFVSVASMVQNDTLNTALVVATLVPMARIVRFGSSRGRVAAMAAGAGAACLTRVTSIPVVLVAVGTVMLAGWIWSSETTAELRVRLARAARPGLIVLGVTVVVAGWFVALNEHRYGGPTGGSAVNAILAGTPEPGADSPLSYLLHPRSWLIQFTQLTGGLDSDQYRQPAYAEAMAYLLMGLLAAGIVAAAIRLRRRTASISRPQWLCVAALALTLALCMSEIAVHAADGGGVHGRYLLPAAGAIGVGAATVLLCLPRVLGVLTIGVVLLVELNGALRSHGFRSQMHTQYHVLGWFSGTRDGMTQMNVPAPALVLSILVGVTIAGLVVQVVVLSLLGRRTLTGAR
jgi:hypothetical protein